MLDKDSTEHYFLLLCQKNYEKLSLHSSSNGAAHCSKSEFSENTDLPVERCQSAHGKDEERTYEEILVEDCSTSENSEKGSQ